jgi:hypothetical protein
VDARSAETVVNYTQRLKMEREVEKRADLQTRILRHDPQAAYRILAYAKAIRAHLEQEALALRERAVCRRGPAHAGPAGVPADQPRVESCHALNVAPDLQRSRDCTPWALGFLHRAPMIRAWPCHPFA